MRRELTLVAILTGAGLSVGCRPSSPPPVVVAMRPAPLPPPASIDARARGAAYLAAIQAQVQPAWGQYLEDCRTRLPASHPLNVTTRTATVELAIDRAGHATIGRVLGSGDLDYDRAMHAVIRDATLPAPPIELLADDDRVHVAWLFARDRRQAGAATATIVDLTLPIDEVVDRLLAQGELDRAARRLMIAEAAITTSPMRRLMVAALREVLATPAAPASLRAVVIEAIGRGKVVELGPEVRLRIEPTQAFELRVVAMGAVAMLGDLASVPPLLAQLAADVDDPRLSLPEV
ncbi:MAG: hypothetical protein NT062_14920, partial [Proteobacteria bacterium]|nr:hypothetical protein [Pseudomonadota bacterium]